MIHTDPDFNRASAVSILALAKPAELAAAIELINVDHIVEDLKRPEVGLVMVRGKIGGDGAAFNVGEATVAKVSVRLHDGTIGVGARLGRDLTAARHAAILDAVWQQGAKRSQIEASILRPVQERIARERHAAAMATASSRVEFFTMAREAT